MGDVMPQVVERWKVNPHLGEALTKDRPIMRDQDSYTADKGRVGATSCVRCGAQCGAFSIEPGAIHVARLAMLARKAGWVNIGPRLWVCGPCDLVLCKEGYTGTKILLPQPQGEKESGRKYVAQVRAAQLDDEQRRLEYELYMRGMEVLQTSI